MTVKRVLYARNLRIVREAEERKRRAHQQEIIGAFEEFLVESRNSSSGSARRLPHPKSEIVEALLNAVANARAQAEANYAAMSIMTLATIQNDPVPDISGEMRKLGASDIDELSPDEIDQLFQKLDVEAVQLSVSETSQEVSEYRLEIEGALAKNHHLLPWYIKLWHKIRQQGAYSPFAEEFVTIRYSRNDD